ncbi:MAG: hypothetical protein HY817_00075 [Candidatus Abawacabacteria bacterium]|nr:hypothetical protein [Candidatus Abawacabacteria bacterium]
MSNITALYPKLGDLFKPVELPGEKTGRNQITEIITQPDKFVFTTGIGLSPTGTFPYRLPAILVPTLHAMEQAYMHFGKLPEYLVYQATEFIAESYNMNLPDALSCSDQMRKYLERYIDRFHPRLRHNVHFRFGMSATMPGEDIWAQCIKQMMASANADASCRDAIEKIMRYKTAQVTSSNVQKRYATANVLYNGGFSDAYPFKDIVDGRKLVLVGGEKEQPFFYTTRTMSQSDGLLVARAYVQKAGSFPSYYTYLNPVDGTCEDCLLADNEKQQLVSEVRYDWKLLAADGATYATLVELRY